VAGNSDKQRTNSGKQRGKPFAKGDSRINRSGRPRGYAAFREAMRGLEDDAREALAEELKVPSRRAFAAKTVLEFGFGKAPSAPDDLEAMKAASLPPGFTKRQVLQLARVEIEEVEDVPQEE